MHLDQLTTNELIRFAKEELDVSEEELRSTETNEPLRQKLLDELLDIEVDEISAAGAGPSSAKTWPVGCRSAHTSVLSCAGAGRRLIFNHDAPAPWFFMPIFSTMHLHHAFLCPYKRHFHSKSGNSAGKGTMNLNFAPTAHDPRRGAHRQRRKRKRSPTPS